jgi:hypothetical protein
MKQYYWVSYSWVSKENPTEDYGTITDIVETSDIKLWWDRTCDHNYEGDKYFWTLNGVNKV